MFDLRFQGLSLERRGLDDEGDVGDRTYQLHGFALPADKIDRRQAGLQIKGVVVLL